ncbi:hypothetical protein V491_08370 [Pseudogymnoascus sp. VKM F-3775]|nr:hypothetical protein V491_08370 [Pseudogymnoascus sp. VKM F-3775]
MEETQVIIVGAGPAGLTLGLCLAQCKIASVVLEREQDVTTDPRGVYLTGDAVRILCDQGLGPEMPDIGHGKPLVKFRKMLLVSNLAKAKASIVVQNVNFHKSTFSSKPYFTLDTSLDSMNQALPNGILQSQPKLEHALRRQVQCSQWCTLRIGCEVVSQLSDEPPTVEYTDETGNLCQMRGQFLIGADGKLGIVRKHFLEPTADIRQEEGTYKYAGTWVAANLKITLPTPRTHPQFPLWEAGYTPEDVYNLFWPKGWHFCSPPGKATATGRFGPYDERLWRHEFRQEDWDDSMNATELLWEHITPMITRERDRHGRKFPRCVQFPRDCIRIIRCRPFRFVHKVVNKWFDKRTILIGDAAHVFPPFAGQGIGSGVRDAHQLAWRLAVLLKDARVSKALSNRILEEWSLERRKSVDDAALFSMLNGRLSNDEQPIWLLVVLRLVMLMASIPFLRALSDPVALKEREGLTTVKGGCFLDQHNGGARLAQIFVRSFKQGPILTDCLFQPKESMMTLLIISTVDHDRFHEDAQAAIEAANISHTILSKDSIVFFSPHPIDKPDAGSIDKTKVQIEIFWPAPCSQLEESRLPGYDQRSFINRLGRSTTFAIIRPDFYVFACARYLSEFVENLASLKAHLEA